MNHHQILVVLSLVYSVYGLNCVIPKYVDFTMENSTGLWRIGAYLFMNPFEAKMYENASCGYFYLDGVQYKWDVDFPLGESGTSDLGGTMSLPETPKGTIKAYYEAQKIFYDSYILGREVNSWVLLYSCSEVTPNYTSALIILFLRDATEIEDVISKKEVQDSLKEVTSKTINDFRKTPFINCQTPQFFQ